MTAREGTGPVLVVDDDPGVREAVGHLLGELELPVAVAADGQQALAVLRGLPVQPRLILLDLMMPVMNGWQFLEERRRDPAISQAPVVIMSVALDASAALPEVAGYLRKPLTEERVVRLLDQLRAGEPLRDEPASAPAPRQPSEPLRVLLIQQRDEGAALTEELLGRARGFEFQVRRARSLAEGLGGAALAETDVVLLDLELTGQRDLRGVAETVRRAPELPLVVLSVETVGSDTRERAIRMGAQDIIEKELQSPELLGRALHHAFERQRLRAELERTRELAAHERERRGLERWARPRASVAAEMLGQSSLKQSLPALFRDLVAAFTRLCETAVSEKEHELDSPSVRGGLQRLAEQLADLRVGPGDIVDIYQAALSSEESERGAARREEARLMLIGLLGNVLARYRLHLGSSRPSASSRQRSADG